jgi:uncharacterized membrane protein
MKTYIIAYFSTALAFVCIDAIWLTNAAELLYQPELGDMLLPEFKLLPAVLFYLMYMVGIVVFAVAPALGDGKWSTATWRGALFGLIAYATYDLTNQATLKGWSTLVTVADLIWGTFLTGTAATVGFMLTRRLTSDPA